MGFITQYIEGYPGCVCGAVGYKLSFKIGVDPHPFYDAQAYTPFR